MIQKKVCMLGSFAVGKTSLIARFVHSIFHERYLTTVGVKIHKKQLQVGGREVNLLLWDLQGDDEYQRVRMSYLRGAGGYFLVADGTRRSTLDQALNLHRNAREFLGDVPHLLLINKHDLRDDWEIGEQELEELSGEGWTVLLTSAKTGENVEAAFETLTVSMLKHKHTPSPTG